MTTIGDVARHAGVAASTVSYVLSGKRPVSEQTRHRVQRSIKELNYQPARRSPRAGKQPIRCAGAVRAAAQ